jgi:uncharacterized protein YjaG (DUF416 family)
MAWIYHIYPKVKCVGNGNLLPLKLEDIDETGNRRCYSQRLSVLWSTWRVLSARVGVDLRLEKEEKA